MKKYIITVLVFLVVIVAVNALFLSEPENDLPVVVNPLVKPSGEILETNQNTICNSDNDCWCRSYNGTGFQPGKVPSLCNLQIKKCVQCYYE